MLISLLRDAAAEAAEQPIVVTHDRVVSYRDCLDRSESIARSLAASRTVRLGCVVSDAAELLALLCGSSAIGTEVCVYPADLDEPGIDRLAAAFDHDVIITDREIDVEVSVLALRDLAEGTDDLPPLPDAAPVLILTTGTTGHQKGARHDWARLIAGLTHPDPEPGARWLLAYNLNQFAGVQILLHVLASRATLVAPRSNRPRDALDALRELDVTHVSATPTFWRLLVALIGEEALAEVSLKQLTLGGEAVPSSLLDELRKLFPQARVSQVYGATEFGLGISVRDGSSGLPATVLERGEDSAVQMRIVDGELQVRSRVGMIGYYGEPDGDGGWRATGDLVEQRGDRIHFVGRASETVNVGGVKVHPLPVEEVVAAVPGVELVRAYGRPNPITGQIVAVDVVALLRADRVELEAAIRDACESLPPAARPRRIRFVPDLDVRGQKIVRGSGTAAP